MNQRYAVASRLERRGGSIRTAVEFHSSGVGVERAGDDIHQRALPRAVLSYERVNPAGFQLEIDSVECHSRPESFADR